MPLERQNQVMSVRGMYTRTLFYLYCLCYKKHNHGRHKLLNTIFKFENHSIAVYSSNLGMGQVEASGIFHIRIIGVSALL